MRATVAALLVVTWQGFADMPAAAQQEATAPDAPSTPLPWAYVVAPPGAGGGQPVGPPPEAPLSLDGSERTYTLAEVQRAFDIADWRPDLHPEMPPVVAQGRRPEVMACGFCHYPNGQGRPENASLAGLPADYIIQQMRDYQAGLRVSSEPLMGPPRNMVVVAKAANEEEIRAAAEYFASMPYRPWIRVVESSVVPRTVISGGVHVPAPGDDMEPIGQRIVEMPEDPARAALRDPASGFVAHVPPGSLERGRAVVAGETGSTIACAFCHGSDLKGIGAVPGIVGRSPSYVARQLYDFQSGARRGVGSDLMAGVVARLSVDEILAIAAYAASLQP